MNYRVKNISQPHGADASGAVIFSDNFTPPPVKKSIITGEAEGKVILVGDALVAPPEELHIFGETLQKKTTGAQLFDKDTVVLDSYISDENGNVLPDSTKTACASDYISVGDLSNISVSGSSGKEWMAFYDNEKSFVSGKNGYGLIQVPENAVYARFTVKKESLGTFMVNEGTTAKSWEPYTGNKPSPSPEYPQKMLPSGSVMTTGAQLLNSDEMIIGGLRGGIGDEFETSTRIRTGYIPVKAGVVYSLSGYNGYKVANTHIYDSSKTRINNFTVSAPIPEQGAYVRISFGKNDDTDFTEDDLSIFKKSLMFNEGETALPYEPYTGGKPAVNPEAGEIGVYLHGKNLFDANRTELLDVNISDPLQRYGVKMSNLGSGKYTISTNKKDTDVDRYIYAIIKHYDGSYSGTMYIVAQKIINTITIDIVSGDELIIYNAIKDDLSFTIELFKEFGIKVEYGESATAYEPYKQLQTVTLPTPGGLPGIPVNSNGNYTDAEGQQWLSDSIEYKNEKLMYVQRVETLRLLTDVGSIDSQNGYLNINNFLNADITRRSGSLCTHLTYGDIRGDNVFWIDSSGTGVRIKISKYTTSEEYLSWLAENEVYLTYPCANPIEKEISDPNLINQLKSLRLNSPNTTIVNDANAFQKLKYLKETFTMANVNFRFGTYEQYKAVASKDTNTLYFVDGVIYKGDVPYSQKVEMVSAFPDTANAAQGILYVNSSTYEAKFFNGTDFTTVFVGTVGNMDDAGNDNKVVTQAAVKAYVTKQLADADIPTDGAIDEKINAAKEEAITEAVSQAGTAADQKDAALKTQLEQTMDTKIAAQVASVFRFKGSKANKGEIDAIEGMVTGDVWHSEDDGKEYVYDGEAWELLGFTVDLSAYATTAAVTQAINAKAEELTSAIATAKSEAIAAAKTETTTQVSAHAGDKTIHITGEERTAWNAKADTSYVDSAKQAAITAAASDATTKANQALTDAKAYTDQKNSAMDTRMKAVEAAVTWGEIA